MRQHIIATTETFMDARWREKLLSRVGVTCVDEDRGETEGESLKKPIFVML